MSKEEVEHTNIFKPVLSPFKKTSTWTRVAFNHNQTPLVSINTSALKNKLLPLADVAAAEEHFAHWRGILPKSKQETDLRGCSSIQF